MAASSACSTDASELVPGAISPSLYESPLHTTATPAPRGLAALSSLAQPTAQPQTVDSAFVPRANRPGVPDDATQALVVTTGHWKHYQGQLRRYEREDGGAPWTATGPGPTPVSVGRYGLAWGRGLHPEQREGPTKFEGDHRSPAGVFDLGEARGYAKQPPAGTTWPFKHSGSRWRCMDNPRSGAYNTFFPTGGLPLAPSAGIAPRETVFEHMLFVLHNTSPVLRGAGSCVFLHVWAKPQHPTQGCVAMSRDDIVDLLPWLDLDRRPVLVQLPESAHRRLQQAWALPPLD